MKPIAPRLIEEYRNPLAFIEPQVYRSLRTETIKRAVIIMLIGIGFLIIDILPSGDSRSPGVAKGQLTTVLLGIGLPLFGFYQLLRIKHIIIAIRRAQLVWLNPELRSSLPAKKVKRPSPLRVRIFWDSLLVIGSVAVVTAWALYLASR